MSGPSFHHAMTPVSTFHHLPQSAHNEVTSGLVTRALKFIWTVEDWAKEGS